MQIETHELTAFPLFRGLTEDDVRDGLASMLIAKHFPAGAVIFEQGQAATGFYLIREGVVKVYKLNPEGREQVLHVFQTGDSFAEAAVFHGRSYPANAQALKDSHCFYISREALLKEIQRNPEFAFHLLAGVTLKLRAMVSLVEDLTLRDARGRLSRYISTLLPEPIPPRGPVEFTLPFPQNVLARMLGITSETLSRTLKAMYDEGVLLHETGRWVVLRPDLLVEQIH